MNLQICKPCFCARHDHLYRYAATATGLGSEIVEFSDSSPHDFTVREGQYILRPEVVESLYILNQLTGDPIYREMGWEIFQSIERYCKTKIAYGHYPDVQVLDLEPDDAMESFFLGETLKYLYLLMDPDSKIDILNKVREG